jgi:hypothetical protein
MTLSRRQLYVIFAVGFLITFLGGAQAFPALATLLSFDNEETVSDSTIRAPSGPAVHFPGTWHAELSSPFPDANTVEVASDHGNVTLTANGHAHVQLDQVAGTYTNVSALDVATYNLTIDPEDKQAVVVGGETETLAFTTMGVDDGEVDFVYSGTSGSTTLTIEDLPADTDLEAVDADTGDALDVSQSDGSGSVTFTMPNSEHRVFIQTTSRSAPAVNNSAAEPRDGDGISGQETNLSIPVSDADFDRYGDTVTVEFYWDGNLTDTQTITSNQTVETTVSNISGGEHKWHVELEDSYGMTTTSDTFGSKAPLELFVHRGENISELVTKEIDVEIYTTADGSNFHETRTVSDGSVVFSGMPDQQLTVELNATNYTSRKLIIDNPYAKADRHTVLYDSRDSETFTQCFSLDSQAAGFSPSDTWLTMQVFIDGQWRDAAGGNFQAANRRCLAQQDTEEYRLIIEDRSGNRRSLGGYTADIGFRNQVIPLTVEGVSLSLDRGGVYRWEVAAHDSTPDGVAGEGNITFKLESRDATVEDLRLVIYEQGNESNELDSVEAFGTIDTYQASFPLTENQTETSWVVEWSATVDGTEENGSDVVQASGGYVNSPLSPLWLKVFVGAFFIIIGGVVGALHAPYGALIAAGSGALLHTVGLYQVPETTVYFALSVAAVGLAASKAGGA